MWYIYLIMKVESINICQFSVFNMLSILISNFRIILLLLVLLVGLSTVYDLRSLDGKGE